MFWRIFKAEVRRHLGEPTLYIFTAVFFLMTFLFAKNTNPNTVVLVVRLTREWHNAPLIIARIFSVWGGLGLLVTMVMAGKAVVRDFMARSQDFYLTAPIGKTSYLMGRFLGSLSANLLLYLGVIAGFFAGALVIDPACNGPFSFNGFLQPLLWIAIPNLFIAGSLFFSLATRTRRMVMTYVAGIAFLMLSMSVTGLLSRGDHLMLRALADPFGYAALSVSSLNWTIAEINRQAMPLSNYLILNRLLWCTLGAAALLSTWRQFKMHSAQEGRGAKAEAVVSDIKVRPAATVVCAVPTMHRVTRIRQSVHWIGRELGRILRHPAYLILTVMGAANVFSNFMLNVDMTGSQVQPLTSWYLAHVNIAWGYMIPLVILFGGMIVWRERDHSTHPLYDVLPLPNWMAMASKLMVLVGMQFVYLLIVLLTGVLAQLLLFQYTQIETGLYLQTLFGIEWLSYIHMAIVVVFIQNLTPSKSFGFFLSTLYFVFDLVVFGILDFDQTFLRYGHVPGYIYSNINGFGHFSTTLLWYTLLWALAAVLLLTVMSLLWRRDEETHLKHRFRLARKRWNRSTAFVLAGVALLFVATFSWILFNKFSVNHFYSRHDLRARRAAYEKAYSVLSDRPQPMPVHIGLNIDFYPEQRGCRIAGHYRLKNKFNQPLDSVLVNLSDRRITAVHRLAFSKEAHVIHSAPALGVTIYRIQNPLAPGDEVILNFDLEFESRGFTDNNPKNELAANGSSLVFSMYGWSDYFPTIGYNSALELSDAVQRSQHGLKEKPPYPALEALEQVQYGMGDAFVTYEARISTSPAQTVVANGTLVNSWLEAGRRHYHFKSEAPMRPEFNFTSQTFASRKTQRNGRSVEVYFNPSHHYNVDRILAGTADALAYGEAHFTRYPYDVVRVQENNEYMGLGGARALPSMVQWRESAGFLSRLDEQDIDMVYFIAAHEMAHQWWGVTLMPAALEGAVLATEMLAQYTAMRCFENRYGPAMTRRMLKKDMNGYLRRRQRDLRGERPMLRSYFNGYMTYDKSNVIMYALKEYIGEPRINRALQSLLQKFEYREKEMATSVDVVQALRRVTPDSLKYLITDLFETITLWENRAISAEAQALENGRYLVRLHLELHKFRADSIGTQTEIPLTDYLPVMIFGEDDAVLYNEKVYFDENKKTLEISVDGKPMAAGLDPHLLLIDRKREDNRMAVQVVK